MKAKSLLIVSVFLNISLTGFVLKQRYYVPADVKAAEAAYQTRRAARTELINTLPIDSTSIVFLGDSHIEYLPLQEIFGTNRVKNRGVGGDKTVDVLHRLSPITSAKPAVIYLCVGINDLSSLTPPDSAFFNYRRICETICQQSPGTKLFVQSVLPNEQDLSPKIEAFNQRLKLYCNSKNLAFVTLYPSFLKEGGLNPSLTYDGTHLNVTGYRLWKELLTPYLIRSKCSL